MKILIVAGWYWPNVVGGGEKVAQLLAEALQTRGHDTVVVTATEPSGKHEIREVNGIRVHYLPLGNIYFSPLRKKHRSILAKVLWHALDSYNPFMASALGRVLDAECPGVVNTHNIAGFSVAAWAEVKKRRLPLVHSIHSYYVLCPKCTMFRGGRICRGQCADCRVYSLPRSGPSHLVDVAVWVSRFTLEKHQDFGCFPCSENMVIHNACTQEPGERRSLDGVGRALRFGFLGRLHPTKGTDLLLRSFLELPVGSATLTVAGRGETGYERDLRALAGGSPGIQWRGFVPPEDLLRQVDVLVVPSLWHDPAPLVVTEAMAHGVPVIGSRRGGIPELMGEGTGWTFEPDEPGALTRVMQRVIEARECLAAMGERARERAHLFSVEAMISGYLRAYAAAVRRNDGKAKLR